MSTLNQQTSAQPPQICLSEAHKLSIGDVGWGALISYVLDSVKIDNHNGNVRTSAIVKVKDVRGETTVLFKGTQVATLLGVSFDQWKDIEKLSRSGQLFYRPFKLGLKNNFPIEQQLFYSFCERLVTREVLFINFKKVQNWRKTEANVSFLEVLNCSLPTLKILKIYNFDDA